MPSRNLELKARCADLRRAANGLVELGAEFQWTKRQTDTYFQVPRDRLKLRQHEGRDVAELIAYNRANDVDVRASDYQLVPIPDPAALKSALARTLGVRVVVAKHRTLWTWYNVRIHLDEVESLGTFIEFEAVLAPPDEPEASSRDRLEHLTRVLQIRDADRVCESYSDLIERAARRA